MISRQQNRKAIARLTAGWTKSEHKPTPPPVEIYPTRRLTLDGPKPATVTLTEKCGTWFVTAASGSLSLYDFSSMTGWGDTEVAVKRCARRLGLTISENTTEHVPTT